MDMGNFGFPATLLSRSEFTKFLDDSDSDSSLSGSEDSDSYSYGDSNYLFEEEADSVAKKYHSCFNIKLEDVQEIEKCLDLHEFISIMFLLFDDTNYALQEMRSMITAGSEHFSRDKLFKWANTGSQQWIFKLLEALAVVQNYTVLVKLGFSKRDIVIWRDNPLYLSKPKKVLYSLCECLNREQANELVERVRLDAKFKDDITMGTDPIFTEFHILFWMSNKYINIDGEPFLANLSKCLKLMNLFDKLTEINEDVHFWLNSTAKSKPNRTDVQHEDLDDESYTINDPNNVGLCIVINMAHFEKNKEQRKEFKDKLKDDLGDRNGTEADVENLKSTFEGLKFKFVVKHDIFHDQVINEIHQIVIKNFCRGIHSVIVLCVLSHGDKGVVYAANSIPVRNEDIINSISNSSPLIGLLAEIPKVIIIQACQGKRMLFVESKCEPKLLMPDCGGVGPELRIEGNDHRGDGIEHFDARDTLVCMATIEGYIAVRSTIHGTIYIQELCRCLREFHAKKHFHDILTKVQNNLNNEKMYLKTPRPVYMTPETRSTLRKTLYLTNKLMIKRVNST